MSEKPFRDIDGVTPGVAVKMKKSIEFEDRVIRTKENSPFPLIVADHNGELRIARDGEFFFIYKDEKEPLISAINEHTEAVKKAKCSFLSDLPVGAFFRLENGSFIFQKLSASAEWTDCGGPAGKAEMRSNTTVVRLKVTSEDEQ